MKFSIVTISFNQARFLERAIRSVIEQEYPDIEYIVVDSGSSDGSRTIIERYRDRITEVIFEPDNGPADGLNKGFSHATGEIYGYLNGDDMLLPGTINKVANYFDKNKTIDVLSGHCYLVDEKESILHKVFSHNFDLRRYYAGLCVLVQPSTFFRSYIFRKTNKFNVQNNISWDGELAIDLAMQGARFAVVHDYLSCFRVYSKSISGSPEYLHKLEMEHLKLQSKIGYVRLSYLTRKYLWITGWMLQPITLTLRIIDGLKYRNRVL
jgi:glycosyltransferase involved in cell wall biosynthesis